MAAEQFKRPHAAARQFSSRWSCDDIVEAIKAAAVEGVCSASQLRPVASKMARHLFGSFEDACAAAGVKSASQSAASERKWTPKSIIDALRAGAVDGICSSLVVGMAVTGMARKHFGTFAAACEAAGVKATRAAGQQYDACTVDGCARPPRSAKNPLCETHYYRQRRNGTLQLKDGAADRRNHLSCIYCGCRGKGARYCSSRCRWRHQAGLPQTINCMECSTEFFPLGKNLVCSDGCDAARLKRQAAEWRATNIELARSKARRHEYLRKARKHAVAHEDIDRTSIFERDGWICMLCGVPVDREAKWPDPMFPTLDHKTPLSKGGAHTAANVQCAHLLCNVSKGAREAPMKTVKKPSAAPADRTSP